MIKFSLNHDEMKDILSQEIRKRLSDMGHDACIPPEHCYFELIMDGMVVDTYGQMFFTYDPQMALQVKVDTAPGGAHALSD